VVLIPFVFTTPHHPEYRMSANSNRDIPLPIVRLNRWLLVVGILAGFALGQPLFTTALFAILLPATVIGQRASLVFWVGKRLFARQLPTAEREDRRMQRFNNTIATILLGAAQIAFLTSQPVVGWTLALMVAAAAAIALAGFCIGCFLYYQFKLQRFRLFGA
jgi:hypothetical protein